MVRIGYPADARSAKVRLSCALPSPRRPMIRWFSRMPLTLRLPLAVAAMIFLVSTGTTQLAIQVSSNQFERQMERIGQVYLDGLSAALVPAAASGDGAAMTGTLRQALTVHVGVEDRRLVVLDAERIRNGRRRRGRRRATGQLRSRRAVTAAGSMPPTAASGSGDHSAAARAARSPPCST